MLLPDHAAVLGYSEDGEFTPGEPARLLPPSCTWQPADPAGDLDSLMVLFATDLTIAEYTNGGEPSESEDIGGLTWSRYLDPVGGESVCLLMTELSATSFVTIVSSDFTHEEKACDAAKAAAPYVASQLPGGAPAPTPEPVEPSPLADVDACSLLTVEQAEELGRRGQGEPLERDSLLPPGCQWIAADGDRTQAMLVYVEPERAPRADDEEPEIIDVSGRQWKLYATDLALCHAVLEVTEESYVRVSVTAPDTGTACEGVRKAIPLVTENLPG